MSEKYTATGTVKTISPEQTRGSFTFRTLCLTVHDDKDSKWDQHIEFQLASRVMAEADKVKVGDAATVSFNLRGREWTKPETGEVKVFNTLDAWRIEPVAGASAKSGAPERNVEDDEIPF